MTAPACRSCSSLLFACALSMVGLVACAGTLEGEVDGDQLPPLLSGYWAEGDNDGEGFRISATASTSLDVCGSATALVREMVDAVATKADEVDEGDDEEDVYDDLQAAYEDAWRRHMPEDFWTVGASVFVKDEDDLVDDYGLGEDADLDMENPAFAGFTICHQEGFLDLDDDGSDDNRTCFAAKSGELEVVAFDDKGGIELTVEAEMAESDDLDEEVGDVEASLRMGGCEQLDEANKDLEDANEDLRDALEDSNEPPPSEGEGEGEGETCSLDDDCLGADQLCDGTFGVCVDPLVVTGGCPGSTYLGVRAPSGPIVFGDAATRTSTYCDDELTVSFNVYDPNDDLGTSPYVTAVDNSGYSLSVMSTTSYGTSLVVSLCLDAAPTPVAIQVQDELGNSSNALCSAP